ncbi:MAG: phosphotransferase [Pseudomonadales bacterium]|nr:phosphotransferase [Pseudomonadales bacterium]
MIDFYALDSTQQKDRMRDLATKALGHWGLEQKELSFIKYRENAVFKLMTTTGERYALRIHRAGYHTNAELRSELEWIQALDEYGIEVPAIVPTLSGDYFAQVKADAIPEPRQIDLFQWVEGEPMGSVESQQDKDTDNITRIYHTIGSIAARLHNQATKWQLPDGFTRHAWDADGLAGDQPFWGPFWEFEMLNKEQRELLLQARDRVYRDLLNYGKSSDNYSLIHADFVAENLMVSGDRVKLIDFDDAGFGWHLFELATALYFIRKEDFYGIAKEALIHGYREHRPLSDQQLNQLPLFMLARGFTYLGWAQTRKETETAQQLGPLFIESACDMAQAYLAQ